jgi:hypothetical protein
MMATYYEDDQEDDHEDTLAISWLVSANHVTHDVEPRPCYVWV